ncbi:putative claudin-24 isoform X2 [Scleropages formosus]|uniref:putative claudin-24 isoform X2 n=1 Tax=Scleropages formosus TaxID=113540 RepID=UPI000878E893|nr:putative claudin-24 isoform X2 [Scleropages formosus]
MHACMCALELLGMFSSIVAWLCSFATTILPTWISHSTELLPTESYEQGLWESCVMHDNGDMECRAYDTLLGLPQDIKLAQIFMCLGLTTGVLAVLLPIPGLYLINCCKGPEGQRAKRIMKILGGIFCLVTGVEVLIPVSYVAHKTVEHFFDESMSEMLSRPEFGDALFCGWVAGFLHLVSGVLLVSSCFCSKRESDPAPHRRQCVKAIAYSSKSTSECRGT